MSLRGAGKKAADVWPFEVNLTVRFKPVVRGRPRVTAVVGKGVAKKSSERNLIKRRLRAVLYPAAKAHRAEAVVAAKGNGEGVTFAEIREQLKKFL